MKLTNKFAMTAAIAGSAFVAATAGTRSADAALIFQTGSSFSLASLATSGGNTPAILIGDLVFYNFTVVSHSNDAPSASQVTITPESLVINGVTTTGFKLSGAFTDLATSPGGSDFLLDYNVMTLDGSANITDAHILGDPSVIGGGAATVTETWTPEVASSYIRTYDVEPGHLTSLSDTIVFAQPFASLNVQKDILLVVPDGSIGVATLSSVDQTYSEGKVPEPASLGVLSLGAISLMARRRRNA